MSSCFVVSSALAEDATVHRARDIVVEGRALEPAEIFEDTASETEILTGEHIEKLPATNAAEVVRRLPGLRTQQRVQGQEAAVSIEGLPPNYTQILVNGERYTGEVGGVQDLRDLPLADIERIEILRGAQGLRYGSEAGGGVINLVTRRAPEQGVRAAVGFGGGDDGKLVGSATVAAGRGDLRGSLRYDRDQIDGIDVPPGLGDGVIVGANENSKRVTHDVYGSLWYDPSDSLALETRLGWRGEDENLEFEESDGTVALRVPREFERWSLTQDVDWLPGESTRVTGTASWYNAVTDTSVGREFRIDEHELRIHGAAEWFVTTGPLSHALTLGVDSRSAWLDLDEGMFTANLAGSALAGEDVDEKHQQAGFYLIGETEFSEWAALEWGARAQVHSRFDTKLVPHVGLLVRPVEGLKFRFSYGRNYFTPSLRDLFQPPSPNQGGAYFLAGNPELQPETAESWRAGVEWSPRRWISLSLTGFWNDLDDHIRSVNDGVFVFDLRTTTTPPPPIAPGILLICEVAPLLPQCRALESGQAVTNTTFEGRQLFRKFNLNRARTRGFEGRVEYRPHRRFELMLGYTWLDTFVDDPQLIGLTELPNEPHHTVDGTVRVIVPRIETSVTVQARWRGRALVETTGTGLLSFANGERSDDSLFVDVRVSRKFLANRLELYADVKNLGNERFEDSYLVRGRTWFLGFRMNFPGGEK